MRNLINLVTIPLAESRGLGARRAGEEFVNRDDPNDTITVNSVKFYPEGATQYKDYDTMVLALENLVSDMTMQGIDVSLIQAFKQSDLAFGVAAFDTEEGGRVAWVKPYRTIKHDPTQNQWDNQNGIPGYRYNSKSAAKAQAGMTPQDVLTQPSNLTAGEIVEQIAAKFGNSSPLTKVATAIASGAALPIEVPVPEGMSFVAFRDYFCELLHPIALQRGTFKGNAGEAADKFLGEHGFAGASINFGTDKTEGLSDSIMIGPDGRKIKISSKGAGGAQASTKNLIDAAEELKIANPKLYKKHKEVIDLVQQVRDAGQNEAPLILGIKYGIISMEDADDITNFKKMPLISLDNVPKMGISKGLKKLIQGRTTNTPESINLFFHCIAAVASKAAEHVNEHTNFSEAASEILNNGALVQVYTKASERGGKWILQSFDTVWPSTTVSGVLFSAQKTYYSTGIKGNFTFKILKNGAKDTDVEPNEPEMPTTTQAPGMVTGKRTSIRPPGAVAPTKDLGRERR